MPRELQATIQGAGQDVVVGLTGRLEDLAPGALGKLVDELPSGEGNQATIDLTSVERFGGLGVSAVATLVTALEERGWVVRLRVADDAQGSVLRAYGREIEEPAEPAGHEMDFVDRFGERTIRLRESTLSYFYLLLKTLEMAGLQILGRARGRWPLTVRSIVRMGAYAMPLITLISGLIGSIMALNSAKLLKQFGQEYRVADLVGLSITREIGPLLTAMLVAGRSGSSLTAEIGTMEVAEEVDALEVMGVRPVGYLVAPRLIAMALVLPALTIIADVVGIAGGLGVAVFLMDVSPNAYMSEIRLMVKSGDVLGGLLKAFFFGMVIVSVAAHQGFATRGGAAGVGKYTTRSVVLSIIWIIIVDAVFTTVQYLMD